MSVAPQVDVSGAAISGLGFLKGGIELLSTDDIHPHAVDAAIRLGDSLFVSKRQISNAVDALGGDQSYRSQRLKWSVGLARGQALAKLRGSRGGIATVQLLAALEPYMKGEELNQFISELMVQTTVLDHSPVSSEQFGQLIEQLENRKHQGVPLFQYLRENTKTRPEIQHDFLGTFVDELSALQRIQPSNALASPINFTQPWHVMSHGQSSRIYLKVFEALRSEEVKSIRVTGWSNGAYLAQALHHLCPDLIAITLKGKLICGSSNAKLIVSLDPSSETDWFIQIIKNTGYTQSWRMDKEEQTIQEAPLCLELRPTHLRLEDHHPQNLLVAPASPSHPWQAQDPVSQSLPAEIIISETEPLLGVAMSGSELPTAANPFINSQAPSGTELSRSGTIAHGELANTMLKAALSADVHPSAILAAERIGQLVWINKDIYSKAWALLRSDSTIQPGDLGFEIRLSPWSNLINLVRDSKNLCAAFVFITHLRLHMDVIDIAELLEEMIILDDSGSPLPASAIQLRQFVASTVSQPTRKLS